MAYPRVTRGIPYRRLDSTDKKAHEDPLHFFMLASRPLGNERYAVLEVPQPWVAWHTSKTSINFCSTGHLKTPVYQVVFEHTLVQLMKDVRGERRKNVSMGKIGPEW